MVLNQILDLLLTSSSHSALASCSRSLADLRARKMLGVKTKQKSHATDWFINVNMSRKSGLTCFVILLVTLGGSAAIMNAHSIEASVILHCPNFQRNQTFAKPFVEVPSLAFLFYLDGEQKKQNRIPLY